MPLLCVRVFPSNLGKTLFLDSDIIALQPATEVDLRIKFGRGFAAKPADLATFKADLDIMKRIYQKCGAEMPDYLISATTSGEKMPPYFNAGLIAVDANSYFGEVWSECLPSFQRDANFYYK